MSVKTGDPLAEFKRLSRPRRLKCGVQRALTELKTDSDRQLLKAAMDANPLEIKHSAISTWLAQRDIKCAPDMIGRHRTHKCSCEDDDR